MMRLSFVCIFVCSILLFSPGYPRELADPFPHEEHGSWCQINERLSFFAKKDSPQEIVTFVAESVAKEDLIECTLLDGQDPAAMEQFFATCAGYLQRIGGGRAAILSMGEHTVAQVQHWLEKMAMDHSHVGIDTIAQPFPSSTLTVFEEHECPLPTIRFYHTFPLAAVKSYEDVRTLCALSLVQEMILAQVAGVGLPISSLYSRSSFLLPSPTLRWEIVASEDAICRHVKEFLHVVDNMRNIGFTLEELEQAQGALLTKLYEWGQMDIAEMPAPLVTFHTESFLRNLGPISCSSFLQSAPQMIQSITPLDIAIVLRNHFPTSSIWLHCTPSQSSGLREQVSALLASAEAAATPGCEETNRVENQSIAFVNLPIYEWEKQIIRHIIETMARENVLKLGLKRHSMEKKGKKIRQVHPLRFLGYVFSDPGLHLCMREIHRSGFKWRGFIDGLKERIEEEYARDGLHAYIPGFCELVQADVGTVRDYVNRRDWEGLVYMLTKKS